MSLTVNTLLLVVIVGASVYGWNRRDIMEKWVLNPYKIWFGKEYYRVITSALIHADVVHLIFNCYVLYGFGEMTETIFSGKTQLGGYYGDYGHVMYAVLFITGVIASDIPTIMKHKNDPGYNSLGASGGVSAVVFAFIFIYPLGELGLIFLPGIRIPGFIFGSLYLVYSHVQARRKAGRINHDAHFYGAVWGVLFVAVTNPESIWMFAEQIAYWINS